MRIFQLLLLCTFAVTQAAATSTGMPFLRVSPTARSAALAEAAVALLGPTGAANPATLHSGGTGGVSLAHAAWIQDIRHSQISLVSQRDPSTWSLALQMAEADQLERRTGPSAQPLGVFGVYEGAVTVTHARPWGRRMRVGASVRLLRQAIGPRTATGLAADVGLLYRAAPRLHAGLAVRNVGRTGELSQEDTPLPTAVRAGLSYVVTPDLLIAAEGQRARDGDATAHLGGEYSIGQSLQVRAGYQTADGRGLTAGMGVSVGQWQIDYAYVPFGYGLGVAHRVSVFYQR